MDVAIRTLVAKVINNFDDGLTSAGAVDLVDEILSAITDAGYSIVKSQMVLGAYIPAKEFRLELRDDDN